MGRVDTITVEPKSVITIFSSNKQFESHTQQDKDTSAGMKTEAEPTQHRYSATIAASAVTGDRAEKTQEVTAAQTRHSAVMSKLLNRLREPQRSKFL